MFPLHKTCSLDTKHVHLKHFSLIEVCMRSLRSPTGCYHLNSRCTAPPHRGLTKPCSVFNFDPGLSLEAMYTVFIPEIFTELYHRLGER